ARLMRNRRIWIGRAVWRLGRVFAPRTVHSIELLGFRIVGFHLVVADRPGGRGAIVMTQFGEIFLALAIQRCAVELGRPANEIVDLRLERLAVFIVPGIWGDIAILDEYLFNIPVLRLTRQPVAALK